MLCNVYTKIINSSVKGKWNYLICNKWFPEVRRGLLSHSSHFIHNTAMYPDSPGQFSAGGVWRGAPSAAWGWPPCQRSSRPPAPGAAGAGLQSRGLPSPGATRIRAHIKLLVAQARTHLELVELGHVVEDGEDDDGDHVEVEGVLVHHLPSRHVNHVWCLE